MNARRMRLAGYIALMGDGKGVDGRITSINVYVGTERECIARVSSRLVDKLTMDLQQVGCKCMD
jgi:hypothetical protein